MLVYIYQAALFCTDCGEKAVAELEAEGAEPEIQCPDCKHAGKGATFKPHGGLGWRMCPACGSERCAYDERDYDSGDFPKGPCDEGDSDTPSHCDDCGTFLESDLTSEGERYVVEAVQEARAAGCIDRVSVTEWAPFYSYLAFEDDDEDGVEDEDDEDGVEDDEDDDGGDVPGDGGRRAKRGGG